MEPCGAMEAVNVTPVFPMTSWPNKRVTVFGLGRSGRAAADLLLDLGAVVTIVEVHASQDVESASTAYRLRGVRVFGGNDVADGLRDLDLLVVSPGVPKDHHLLQEIVQRGIPVIGEISGIPILRVYDVMNFSRVHTTSGLP